MPPAPTGLESAVFHGVNDVRRTQIAVPVMAWLVFALTALWHLAFILNLRDISTFGGMRFFWTATLGLAPFLCLALTALLAERYRSSDRANARLISAALAAGLSPWLWLAALKLLGTIHE
jgi:hypothetical protein